MELNLTKPIAFIDLETTGTDAAKDRIVEIAVLKVMPNGALHEKCAVVNPGIPISPGASVVHGFTDEMVKDFPMFAEHAKSYFLFIDDCDMAGFNSNRFDLPILAEEFFRCGIVFDVGDRRMIDVQRIFHKMEQRNLAAAYQFYCEKNLEGAHSALVDVKATFEVLKGQLDRYESTLQNDVSFLSEFSSDGNFVDLGRRLYFEDGIEKFNFGKHKGKPVTDVFKSEPNYFDWIMKSDFPMEFKQKLKIIRERPMV